MPRRRFQFDKATGRVVETTPESDRAACAEITAGVEPFKEPTFSAKPTRREIAQWPIHSESAAVNLEDVAEVKENLAKHGVHTDFDELGRPIFRDRAHRKAHCRLVGLYDKDASYGDPDPVNYIASTHSREASKSRWSEMRDVIRNEIARVEGELFS
jgi:hypothetical protein